MSNGHGLSGERNEHRVPITAGLPITLAAHNSSGEIRVRATDRSDVLIRSVKHGHPGTRRYDEAHLEIDVDGNDITLRPETGHGAGWLGVGIGKNFFKRASVQGSEGDTGFPGRIDLNLGAIEMSLGDGDVHYDLDIELPRSAKDTSVEVRSASGEVNVEGIAGKVNLATASGDARIRGVHGEATVNSASGDLLVEELSGGLTVRTASGDVRVVHGTLDRLGATTASGDLMIDANLASGGTYKSQTVSGDVNLEARLVRTSSDGEPAATLTFQTVSGDARVEPPLRKIERRRWRLGAGDDGGAEIAVKTVSGDLRVRLTPAPEVSPPIRPVQPPAEASEASVQPTAPLPSVASLPPVPTPPVVPPTPPSQAETERLVPPVASAPPAIEGEESESERLAVLQALERGEIDVEEALNRLEAVGVEPTV